MRTLAIAAATLMLGGCQTWGPTWSEVTGQRWYVTNLNTVPTAINKIDNNGAFPTGPYQPIKVEPGPHTILLAAVPLSPGWSGGTDLVEIKVDLEPCKRYYYVGFYENPLGMSWQPRLDYVEPIAGCTPAAPAK